MTRSSHESKIQAAERGARREIARLRGEIEQLVRAEGDDARGAVDSALESVTRLQIVTANIDACAPAAGIVRGRARWSRSPTPTCAVTPTRSSEA